MPTHARTTTTTQRRVSAGTPDGGEFTFARRDEPEVSLVASHPALARTETPLTDAELLKQATLSAKHWIWAKRLLRTDVDDIAQLTVETALRARMNNAKVIITERYIHTVAHGHVNIALRGVLRAEDRKAIGIYRDRIRETEETSGRSMSPNEKKDLAKTIRDTWADPRHRPSEKFVELAETKFVSLDAPVSGEDDGGVRLVDHIAASHAFDEDDLAVDEDSTQARVLDMAENGQRAAARRLGYNAIAELSDAPRAIEGHLASDRAAKARKAIKEVGGVAGAIADWDRGESTPATEALFAPFGNLDPGQRDEVCDLLRRLHTNADDLHDSALKFAVRARRG